MESGLRARHHHRHHPPPPPPGREDCWSEGATGALIEAWGDRYLQLSRGNLRQKDWTDVAGAVNARQEELRKPRKTDIQCKNRVDTIKKKYKLEKSRPGPSLWPFFSRLDLLVGPGSTPNPALKKHRPPPTLANSRHPNPSSHRRPSVSSTVKHRNPHPSPNAAVHSGGSSSRSLVNSPLSTESSREETGGRDDYDEGNNVDEEEEDEDDLNNGLFDAVAAGKKQRRWGSFVGGGSGGCGGGSGGGGGSRAEGAFGELAKAILKVADTYERVESSKQQQMMELERQRMEFAKDLEFQRMQMFMEAQLELEKLKRPKYESGSGKRL